jgi:hypothetical protein
LTKMIQTIYYFLFINKPTPFQNLSFNNIVSASSLLDRLLWTNTSWIRRTRMELFGERNYVPVVRI